MYKSKILLLVFIFIAVWWGSVNIAKIIGKNEIPFGNFIFFTIGVVGTIAYFL